jgi:hypothetical protein
MITGSSLRMQENLEGKRIEMKNDILQRQKKDCRQKVFLSFKSKSREDLVIETSHLPDDDDNIKTFVR